MVVGTGATPLEHPLVTFVPEDFTFYAVQAVSFRTVAGDGVWTIDKIAGQFRW